MLLKTGCLFQELSRCLKIMCEVLLQITTRMQMITTIPLHTTMTLIIGRTISRLVGVTESLFVEPGFNGCNGINGTS